MVAAGFKVYLIDWGKPKKEHAHLGLKDYSHDMMGTALEKIRRHSGSQDLSLMGWCMGGLLCLLYQGQVQDKHIRNMVTVASPIDMESGSGLVAGLSGAGAGAERPGALVSNYSNFRLNTAGSVTPVAAALDDHPGVQDDRPGQQRYHLLGPGHRAVGSRVRGVVFHHLGLPE